MPEPTPHPQQGSGGGARPPSESSTEELVAEDLRRQVAILAEQVRRLGERPSADALARRIDAAAAPAAEPAVEPPLPAAPAAEPLVEPPRSETSAAEPTVELPLPPPPRPRPPAPASKPPAAEPALEVSAELAASGPGRNETAASEPPGGLGIGSLGVPGAEPVGGEHESFEQRSRRLITSVINLAELAAVEIRASAELEAAAIRARSNEPLSTPSANDLAALIERQRQMIATLAAQTERVERAAAVVRAQIIALEAERDHIQRLLESSRRAP